MTTHKSNIETDSSTTETIPNRNEKFQEEIVEGLRSTPKKLSSKYFYDKNGDKLFQEIMAMPEYYLTPCELDIFKNKTVELADKLSLGNEPFDLIELGAGDALKSSYLFRHFVRDGRDFSYMPIDISGNILNELQQRLQKELPNLDVVALEGEYFDMLEKASAISERKKVVLFLGSNIGNMELEEAYQFCNSLNKKLNKGDLVLIGFDLKKNPNTILNAYNDKNGLTAKFNLNLLVRINRELEADFDLSQFEHYQTYDPISGACRSYLVSLSKQDVSVADEIISFEENELLEMEISQKFSKADIQELADKTGFAFVDQIADSKNWFVDAIWQVR
ncbi:L-histidine N(alpha)-methyltransferase [Sphingobacterium hungaricum]|uniref:L-histidine N(Alpha)-methyltransferase n=1 Tax=Sphingobacterium hungaricum TaxID=2082723 RepID=A0A928UWX2_9SPHI|nr:L-histidine N(alpha)-methyltransferase [Sphingobacterium hungaricum]MBE8712099.1 L-histidine N(alpha)-methyltransferase [Sphingobacterium hungaricum]